MTPCRRNSAKGHFIMSLPTRKHPRLKDYDYSQCGCYHITICTKGRNPILSQIFPATAQTERAAVRLLPCGIVANRYIQSIPLAYSGVKLIKHCIMPNHIHLLLLLEPTASVSVPILVRALKRMVTKDIGRPVWQNSFYDVVIRNETMFQCEWTYIDNNPDKWVEDELYTPSS